MRTTEPILRDYTAGRILLPSAQRMGAPSKAQLALINARAGATLSADEVFCFDAVASTDATDTYGTYMDKATTLVNFVADFKQGRALLDSHEIYDLPFGSSVDAVLEPVTNAEGSDATMQVRVTFSILRDHVVNGNKATNDYIRGLLGGTYHRMSVGFGGEDAWICDLCGKDVWNDREHYPGQRWPDGSRVRFKVVGAHAFECSLVYANATPGALVQRVQQLVTERAIPPAEIAHLEHTLHVRFDRPTSAVEHRAAADDAGVLLGDARDALRDAMRAVVRAQGALMRLDRP